ncbi:flagellar basal body-associated FliL family protein [Sphingomonas sp. CFBP8993]|uniref:flagellar basal body-associated FliL family protein n=1 Tax=Sphingomonas sp. CFBP8993 TaxID=3096526 RepID=UPI002A6A4521|nr:flagellar basal body-associated FliL family protein [Sphingomonas sp. CFBP8993]MDY0959418.1 flagellar basal body-associated FliL family protein [Sphingomonas sp. CFBP8993]
MSDAKDTPTDDAPKKKKGKLGKIIVMVVGVLVLLGGGVGAGLYAASSGLIGGHGAKADKAGHEEAEADASHPGPKLVPKAEQKRAGAEGEGGEGGHGGGEGGGHGEGGEGGGTHENVGMKTPVGDGGERYASNYYQLPKDFTSNLRDSIHIVQVGLAISTPYDDTVINNLKTNDLAVRSAVLMTLGDASEDMVTSGDGKRQLQRRLVDAINEILRQKEGFGGVANVYFTNFVVQ